jgi:hypothetical protein
VDCITIFIYNIFYIVTYFSELVENFVIYVYLQKLKTCKLKFIISSDYVIINDSNSVQIIIYKEAIFSSNLTLKNVCIMLLRVTKLICSFKITTLKLNTNTL